MIHGLNIVFNDSSSIYYKSSNNKMIATSSAIESYLYA